MVAATTCDPTGQRFDPRDAKVTELPGEVSIEYRFANHESVRTAASVASGVGSSDVKSPRRQTNCAKPWLPPVASAVTGPSRLPSLPSQTPPYRSTKKL
jgi:hypothetical protein